MNAEVDALVTALQATRELLLKHGDRSLSSRLRNLEERLARCDWTALQSAVSEATGGMGSLRDRWLSLSNGDQIACEEEPEVNAELDTLIVEVERSARAAAFELGVPLVR